MATVSLSRWSLIGQGASPMRLGPDAGIRRQKH
jgi:hypothetical protein